MKISKGKKRKINHNDLEFLITDTEEFETESFSFPLNQPFPTKHYEVLLFMIIGAIATGKSTMAKLYYGNRISQIWGDSVDFFNASDLWATIEAIKNSKKLVHYLIIDDSIPLFDSRMSMRSENIGVTQFYFEIRHALKKHAEKTGNAGGFVIICLISQYYKAIDIRLRKSVAFTVFKSYDDSCDEMKFDEKIIKALKKMKDKSVRVKDYFYRQLAVGIDNRGFYTLFLADKKSLPFLNFKDISGEDYHELQRDYLVDYLVENIDLSIRKGIIRGELYFELDRMRKSGTETRITKSDFVEVIHRAEKIQNDIKEKEKYGYIEEDLILGFAIQCSRCFQTTLYTPRNLEKIPKKPHTICKYCGLDFKIDKNNLRPIYQNQILGKKLSKPVKIE